MKLKRWFRKWAKRFWITLYSKSVRKFRANNMNMKLVGVSGSVGKTSTKFALKAALDNGQNRVLVHEGSYNDPLASLFVLMGVEYPNIDSIPALMKAYLKLKKKSKEVADFDIGILEMGTDSPGEMKQFGKFLELDICVLTAITPEHMQNFKDMRELANEELSVVKYSKKIFANSDLVEKEYRRELEKAGSEVRYFGTSDMNSVRVRSNELQGIGLNTKREFEIKLRWSGVQG
jgi:UDP-N-acetylmuramyl pentapeptide synthase